MKKIVLLGMAYLISLVSMTQNLDNPASNDEEGDLFTGKLTINIPLYTIGAKGADVPVYLSYRTSGVKLNQLASRVGLGWDLQAGGVIQREVRGYPDDFKGSKDARTQIGWLYNKDGSAAEQTACEKVQDFNLNSSETDRATFIQTMVGDVDPYVYTYDTEPDVFSFNINGRTGKFIFNANSEDPENQSILLIPHQNLKVDYTLASNQENITSFTITDESGTQYIFEDIEKLYNNIKQLTLHKNSLTSYYWDTDYLSNDYISGWFLTKIITPYYEEILFEYEYEKLPLDKYCYREYRGFYALMELNPLNIEMDTAITEVDINEGNSYIYSKRIKSITSTNYSIEFNSYQNREDVYGSGTMSTFPKTLNEVIVKSRFNGYQKEIKRFIFYYDYFDHLYTETYNKYNNDDATGNKRLKLTRVTEYSNGQYHPPYLFDYDYSTSRKLPSRYSYSTDLWGCYNGKIFAFHSTPRIYAYPNKDFPEKFSLFQKQGYSGTEYLLDGANRDPVESYKTIGTLTKITYPSGGYKKFEYESDEFHFDSRDFLGGSIRIKKVYECDVENDELLKAEYFYNDITNTSISSGKIISMPVFGYYDPYLFPEQISQEYFNEHYIRTNTDIWNYSDDNTIVYEYVKISKPGFGSTLYKFSVPGTYDEHQDADGLFETFDVTYARHLDDIPSNSWMGSYWCFQDTCYPYPYINPTNYDWNRGQLLSKIDYNSDDTPVKETSFNYQLFYRNGQSPQAIEGVKIGFLENNHYVGGYKLLKPLFLIGKYTLLTNVIKLLSSKDIKYYNQQTTFETIAYEYNHRGQLIKTEKQVGNDTYANKIKYTLDYYDPEVLILEDPPATDPADEIVRLYDKHIFNKPIEIINLVNGNVSSGTLDIFTTKSRGTGQGNGYYIVPEESYVFSSQIPVSDFAESFIEESEVCFYKDSRYEKKVVYDEYDIDGNLLTSHIEGGEYQSSILGYNNSKNIATIQNAYNSDDAEGVSCGFLNFESGEIAPDINNNYWDFQNAYQTQWHTYTGDWAGYIPAGCSYATTRTFYPDKQNDTYVLSAWVMNLSGLTQSNSGIGYVLLDRFDNTISGTESTTTFTDTNEEWEYLEKTINLEELKTQYQITGDVKIKCFSFNNSSGPFFIDDIRFLQENATMVTQTYDPGKGVTSVSDANNISAYSIYDDLGRNTMVKDDDGNIINRTTYNSSRLQLKLTPLTYDFGSVETGQTDTYSFTLTNVRSPEESAISVDISLSQDYDNGFTIISGGGQATISPTNSRTIVVQFNPTNGQRYQCFLDIDTGDPLLDIQANIIGTGGAITFSPPDDHDFGKEKVGLSGTQEFCITNMTGDDLAGGISITNTDQFSIVGSYGFTIPDCSSYYFDIKFQPTTNGVYTETLTVNFNNTSYTDIQTTLDAIGYYPVTFEITGPAYIPSEDDYTFNINNLNGNPTGNYTYQWELLLSNGSWSSESGNQSCTVHINPIKYCTAKRPIKIRCTIEQENGGITTVTRELINTIQCN